LFHSLRKQHWAQDKERRQRKPDKIEHRKLII
jgi:hypothetical protein